MFALPLNRTTQRQRLAFLLLLTGVLAAAVGVFPASAQQPDTVEEDTTVRTDTTRAAASAERKSPVRAVLYSAGGSVLLTPLFGPAMGHFYADDDAQAWRGIALRAGGYGLAGVFWLAHGIQVHGDGTGWGVTAARVTNAVVAIQVWYDIITAWHSAKDYNESHDVSARVAPTVGPRGEQVGLALRVSF